MKLLISLSLILLALPASAQTLTSVRLQWDNGLSMTAGVPEQMLYRVYDVLTPTVGVATTTTTVVTAVCVPVAAAVPVVPPTIPPTFTCTSGPLMLARGNHSLTVTAENMMGESLKSAPVTTGAPPAPRNPRIVITVLVDIP